MKRVYIPKGQTVTYDSLETEHLVVKGCLNVTHGLKARTISGNGVISAGTISADDICARELEAAGIYCLRLTARRVQAAEVFASESAAVSCYLCADYVSADRLTVALHDVGKIDVREIISLRPKKRSLFRLLLVSGLRSLWLSLVATADTGEIIDAEYRQTEKENQIRARQSGFDPGSRDGGTGELSPLAGSRGYEARGGDDEELNRIIALFQLLRDSGYTLKIVPGTPEENAPVFNFTTERIDLPAA